MSLITYNGESKVIKRICELLDTMTGISFVVVQTLPTVDIQTNVIYLVPKTTTEVDNIYDEYINTDGTSQGWELIGTTEIDLSNYYTKTEVDNLIPTDFVPKSTGGIFEGNVEIVKANSGTTNVNSVLRLGNDKAVGTEGNTRGAIQIYDQNGYFTNIFPSDNASSRSVFLPKNRPNNSILAVETDLDEVECNVWNLLREPYGHSSGRTQYQVTFTVDSSGQVIANGTATGTASFSVKLVSQNWNLAVGKAYRLTGCPSGGSDSTYRMNIGFRDSNNTDIVTYKEFGDGLDFIVPSNAVSTFVQINVLSGYQATNLTFTPKIVSLENEKVRQTNVTSNNAVYRVLLSKSATDNEETDTVNKSSALRLNTGNGYLYLDRTHTSTSVQEETLIIGNSKADGTEGANSGILRLYGKGAYYAQFRDLYNYLTGNRNYLLRDATGVLGLYSDCSDFGVKANLNVLDNLLYPPYYHSSGNYPNSTNPTMTYSTNFETGEYTVKGYDTVNRALNLKRYTSGFYLPAGKYRISGCPSGGSSSKYSIRVYSSTESGQTTGIGSDYGSGLEFTLTERTLMQIVFYVNANQNVDLTFRPKLEKLSDWVDLGSTNTGTITVNDVYSEYMAEVTLNCTYGGTTYTRNFIYNFLSNSLSSTAKSFIQTAPCQTQQIGGVVYIHCSTSAKKENNQVTISSGGTWTGGTGGTTSPVFTTATIQLYGKA